MKVKNSTLAPSPPSRSRRQFVRTEVSRTERLISFAIVCLLALIAAAIWLAGGNYDPSLYALRPDALATTAAVVEGKSGTVRERDGGLEEAVASKSAPDKDGYGSEMAEVATAQPQKVELLDVSVAGAKPLSATEYYSPNNLYEKIDGRAPAYLNFNFRQLRCRSFGVSADGAFVDVFEFRMDTPINAFGIFSLERDPKGKPIDFAPDGYAGEMGYFFRQGACYVQIIASDANPKTMVIARALAEERARKLSVDNAGLDTRRRLPSAGLLTETVSFVPENALGHALFKNVFQATYAFEGKKLPFFIMLTTSAEADKAWKTFREFCGRFGGKVELLSSINGAEIFVAENFGTWKTIYHRGEEVGGVYDAGDSAAARKFVEDYLRGEIR